MTDTQRLHEKAQHLAHESHRIEAALLEVLITMRRKKCILELGYSGVFDYCQRGLKLSEAQCYYYKKVAEKSEDVPELKAAIDQGRLSLSQARRLVPVITKENSTTWIEKAANLKQRDLEREVAQENPNARVNERIRPVSKSLSELKLALTSEMESDIKALQDVLSQKRKRPVTLSDVLAWALKTTREKYLNSRYIATSNQLVAQI